MSDAKVRCPACGERFHLNPEPMEEDRRQYRLRTPGFYDWGVRKTAVIRLSGDDVLVREPDGLFMCITQENDNHKAMPKKKGDKPHFNHCIHVLEDQLEEIVE